MARKTKAEKRHGEWIILYEGDEDEYFFYDHGISIEEIFANADFLDHFNYEHDEFRTIERKNYDPQFKTLEDFKKKYNFSIRNSLARWTLWTDDPETGMRAFTHPATPGMGAFKVTMLEIWEKRYCPHFGMEDKKCSASYLGKYFVGREAYNPCIYPVLPDDFQVCEQLKKFNEFWRNMK